MKRIHQVLFAILTVVLLVSCAGKPEESNANTGTSKKPSGIVTIADHLAGSEFDAQNAGIEDGSSLPTELSYYVENDASVTVTDQEFIVDVWKRLCAIEIDVANIDWKLSILDGGSSFSFTWEDGSSASFSFAIFEYYSVGGRGLAPLVDGSDLRALDHEMRNHLELQEPDKSFAETLTIGGTSFRSLAPVSSDGSNFKWDFDGDGVEDTILTRFVDLGDEAPSYTELEAYIAGAPHSEVIDRAYGIEEVRAYENADGTRGLAIIYTAGDYYSHDNYAACTLSWNGEDLVVEAVE